ncbi:MAG: hypothetical protein HYV09_23565 [Deltaproteobacteria bacterium]|nr:hypothetical protein [Deltaproteobacteria bacterium]
MRARGATPRVIAPLTDLRARELAAAGLAEISTGIFGADAAAHDAIAGRPGAFDALTSAVPTFRALGVRVSLVTPLIAPVLDALPAIVAAAAGLVDDPLTLLTYVPDGPVGTAFDDLVPAHRRLRAALGAIEPTRASIEGAPACVLPPSRRSRRLAVLDRSDAEARAKHSAEPCDRCDARPSCPGVARAVVRAIGVDGLEPITSRRP